MVYNSSQYKVVFIFSFSLLHASLSSLSDHSLRILSIVGLHSTPLMRGSKNRNNTGPEKNEEHSSHFPSKSCLHSRFFVKQTSFIKGKFIELDVGFSQRWQLKVRSSRLYGRAEKPARSRRFFLLSPSCWFLCLAYSLTLNKWEGQYVPPKCRAFPEVHGAVTTQRSRLFIHVWQFSVYTPRALLYVSQ
jgi:hypothetical protein